MGCTNSAQVSDCNGEAEAKKAATQEASGPIRPPSARPQSAAKVENLAEAVEEEASEENETIRLLLLGAAESGKTTVLEQIRKLYHQNFTEVELMHRRALIFENIINSMKSMLAYLEQLNMPLADPNNQANVQIVKDELEGIFSKLNPRQFDALLMLWNDAAIQEIYERRSEYNLNDSTKYFFDSLERINALDYRPTPQDLIMVYCPTVGVQNVIFTVHNRTYQLFDIGGQKIDRRKWASMYDGIDAIIFCIAISEYDQKMNEDGSTIRLHDALHLLEQICGEPKFQSTWIFVFLNEVDVLAEKLGKVPIEKYFPEYNGSTKLSDAKAFFESCVMARCSAHPDMLHMEFTCAINTNEMEKILEKIFKKHLKIK